MVAFDFDQFRDNYKSQKPTTPLLKNRRGSQKIRFRCFLANYFGVSKNLTGQHWKNMCQAVFVRDTATVSGMAENAGSASLEPAYFIELLE